MHLDYLTLATKFERIGAKRYLLTHMGPEMLDCGAKNRSPAAASWPRTGLSLDDLAQTAQEGKFFYAARADVM